MKVATTKTSSRGLVVGLLLASGFGRRFDAAGRRNKLLARLPDGQTMVTASARALCNTLEQVAVVVPARSTLVEVALSDLPVRLIRNPRAKEGIGASIAVGIAALKADFPEARGWLIALGDMPFVAPMTIRTIAEALADRSAGDGDRSGDGSDDARTARSVDRSGGRARIVAPVYGGRRGHPVAFGSGLSDALIALQGDVGASVLMNAHAVDLIDCDDPGIVRDIDTPEDLSSLVRSAPP